MNKMLSNQLSSTSCPPCPLNDSIFFNLILGTSYENTKENCLIFLRNFSKQIFFPKRELFKLIINELTLNEYSDKIIGNDESIYLIRQIINKYTKNNILNALFEFVSEKENEIVPTIENKINLNYSNHYSLSKIDHAFSEEESIIDNNLINNRNGNISEKQIEIGKKYERREKSELNIIKNKKNIKLLEKKRKFSIPPTNNKKLKKGNSCKPLKKVKKKLKYDNENIRIVEKKESINNVNVMDVFQKEGGEKKEKVQGLENNIIIEKMSKMTKQQQILEKESKNEEYIKAKKEKEKENNEKNEINVNDKIKIEINLEEKKMEKEEIENNEIDQKERKENTFKHHKSKLKSLPLNKIKSKISLNSKNKSYKTKISKKRVLTLEEVIKLESSDEISLNNSISLSSIVSKKSKMKQPKINKQELSLFNPIESKEKNVSKCENEFKSHLIKFFYDKKKYVYSYKIKTINNDSKIVFFECNNMRCRGKGEYDIDKKVFIEKEKHNIPLNYHKIAPQYFNARDFLLNDDNCNGYQLLKDSNFIKDKEVFMIK